MGACVTGHGTVVLDTLEQYNNMQQMEVRAFAKGLRRGLSWLNVLLRAEVFNCGLNLLSRAVRGSSSGARLLL